MRSLPPALALLLLAPAAGCGDDMDGAVLGEVSVQPAGTVPACSPVTLQVRLAGLARFSVVADGTLLAAGLLYAGEQVLHLPALPDPPNGASHTTLTITAVGSSSRTERRTIEVPRSDNAAPHANAGPIRRVVSGEAVVLDGSGSRDPDGEPLTFAWSVVEGAATIDGADGPRATVTLAEPGVAEVELVVADPNGALGTARTLVRAGDAAAPPVFAAPTDSVVLTADPGQTVSIDATATSANDVEVRYAFLQTAGPAVTIQASGSHATLRAPESEGLVVIEAVADNGYDSVRKRVSVLVGSDTLEDAPPTPRVTAPPTAPLLSEIVLDGAGSSDPERSDLAYLWSVEEAPTGSMLSAASIPGNGTAAASQAMVLMDREGTYRFRLRAVDAVGPSPAIAEVTVESTADIVDNAVGTVHDVALDDAGRAFASLGEGGAVLQASGGMPLYSDDRAGGAVAYAPLDAAFLWARAGAGAAEIVAVRTATGEEAATQELPSDGGEDLPDDVRGIALSPEGSNEGDVFFATNAGFIILDVSEASVEEPIGHPLPIGGEFVHRPPSYTPDGLSEEERTAFIAAQQERGGQLAGIGARPSRGAAGSIEVLSGNPFWVIELDYPPNRSFVTRAPYDPLGDNEANAVLAIGVGPDTEVVMLEGRGVLWRGGAEGSDCFLSPDDEHGCPAPPADECAIGSSDSPPPDALDVTASTSGRYWIASSDGVRRFDPETGRFALLAAAGTVRANAVDVRGGFVAVGTATGLLRVDVGAAE